MDYKNTDLMMAVSRLQDELGGIDDYKNCAEKTTDPELKKVFIEIHGMEKSHATRLLQWINTNAQKTLT